MRILLLSPILCLWLMSTTILTSCNKDETANVDLSGTVYGEAQKLGNGTIKSYVTKDESGEPVSIGIEFTEDALENLPAGHHHGYSLIFTLPEEVAPYNHLSFDWNENGHEPPGTYDVPHFDTHFYFMDLDDRLAISAEDTIQFANKPAAQYMPGGHIWTPGVPAMGAHWLDPSSPELNGAPFTYTFIFGSFDGKMTFIEPMFTLSYLQGKPNESIDIPQPEAYQLGGYFPMTYGLRYHADRKVYTISLDQLMNRN